MPPDAVSSRNSASGICLTTTAWEECRSLQRLLATNSTYLVTLDHTPLCSLDPHKSKKILGVKDCPAGGNKLHLENIRNKVNAWIDKMRNGHLPSSVGWTAYKFQLWPRVRYETGTMTNNPGEAEEVLAKMDYRMLNILGITSTVRKG